ncbi:hypothetical protein DMH03_17800 [Amycolatopsis sp. WAC 01376]|uniref:hypothetical protein n=1 Tax=Amycolatopsis sp. WAC 01376 TaxID=2203195 RepID=UPI000F796BFD|nr:hypothetical protein [Amycolatopsis sp. WAC 01376]RSM60603.1 hypothetical protein DMH03_17800 [Amycolatopsis sp. WAC 01376]
MKRAAAVVAALLGLVVLIVVLALLALWASGALSVSSRPVPQPTVASSTTAPSPAPQHEVVISITGAPGTQFRVLGEVFGDTGPIDLPAAGRDKARFETAKSSAQLDLVVYVAAPIGDDSASCTVTFDGRVIAQSEPVPLENTHTLACRVRSA